jgi:hypothetical protein
LSERRSTDRIEADSVLLNLDQKNDEDLRRILDELYAEEKEVSYRRRLLHGKIDILRAELTRRLSSKHKKGKGIITENDVTKLSDILARALTDRPSKK